MQKRHPKGILWVTISILLEGGNKHLITIVKEEQGLWIASIRCGQFVPLTDSPVRSVLFVCTIVIMHFQSMIFSLYEATLGITSHSLACPAERSWMTEKQNKNPDGLSLAISSSTSTGWQPSSKVQQKRALVCKKDIFKVLCTLADTAPRPLLTFFWTDWFYYRHDASHASQQDGRPGAPQPSSLTWMVAPRWKSVRPTRDAARKAWDAKHVQNSR